MKLLKKSDIDLAKSKERQFEIQEGLKLAKRIDNLREVAAQEDASLSAFRIATLSSIQKEITEETNKLELLKKEVKELEERKVEAQQPLIAEEAFLNTKRQKLESDIEALNERERSLEVAEQDFKKREKTLSQKEKRTADLHTVAQDLFVDASRARESAKEKDKLADTILFLAKKDASLVTDDAQRIEGLLKEREERISAKEEELRKKEVELAKEWSLLKDREALLKRNQKRYG